VISVARGWTNLPRSGKVLLIVNLYPLLGCVLLGWPLLPIVLIYWLENVMIGLTSIGKILILSCDEQKSLPVGLALGLVVAFFFSFVYGAFTTVHGMAIVSLLDVRPEYDSIERLLRRIPELLLQPGIRGSALAMAGSHLYSFYFNFIERGERRTTTISRVTTEPYARMVKLHVGIIAGAWILIPTGSPRALAAVAILVKIHFDLQAHLRQHAKRAGSRPILQADSSLN